MSRRVALVVLAALVVAGVAGVQASVDLISGFQASWSGDEMPEEIRVGFAAQTLGYLVLAPASALLAAASGFALLVVGARSVATRIVAARADARTGATGSVGDADDERLRIGAEVRGEH
ncbi:hypothetical protein [Agromyces sp. LHK192]|uniref:hypothetical protein n=1 Tax=Agromyces sp. LHK192 TaxID=2498704 RepID=UPI000FDBEDFF|nr:hypothetical protein [Agromyces sp. LHK192]